MKRIVILFLAIALLLPYSFAATTCSDPTQTLFRISSPTNAHAEVYNGAGGYTEEICYDAIFGQVYSGASPHFGNLVLKASSATNAHVEQSTLSNYSTLIQYGDLACTFGASCNAAADEVCIATISDTTNAHVATCVGSPYAIKICCSSVEASNTVPVADAGPVQDVLESVFVQLDGSGSSDVEDCSAGDPTGLCLTYSWSCAGSSPDPCPALSDSSNFKPTFTSGNIGEVYILQLIVSDGLVSSLADTVTITVVVPPNILPIADAGPDYSILLPIRSIPLDGSGSTDDEDCGGAGSCAVLDYSWAFPVNGAVCSITDFSDKIRPVITCNGDVGDESTVDLVVTDSGGLDSLVDSATATIQILAPLDNPYLKIVLFNADPLSFSLAAANLQFNQLNVKVKNFGGDTTNSEIVIEVRDSVTNLPLDMPISDSSGCGVIVTGGECSADFSSIINISSLTAGSYKLVVSATDLGTVYDTESLFFIVTGQAAVPELDFVLIPLLALSVLSILFFSDRYSGKAK